MKIVIDLGDIGIESDDDLADAIARIAEFRPNVADLFKGKVAYVQSFLGQVFAHPDHFVSVEKLNTSRVVAEVLKDMEREFPAAAEVME